MSCSTAISVGILGHTGMVGSIARQLLSVNPAYEVELLDARGDLTSINSPYVISCLPSEVAQDLELPLAQSGVHVFSNSPAYRMHPQVPILIPEVNKHSLDLLERQTTPGKIITNSNCMVAFIALALHPIIDIGPIESLHITTLQSISGAGKGGVPNIEDNVIPYIQNEEAKIIEETQKILNKPSLPIGVQVNRIPVSVGHSAVVSVRFSESVDLEQVKVCFKNAESVVFHGDRDRPQLRDVGEFDMNCHVGQLKYSGTPKHLSFMVMGNNLIRGAAGAAILNMETFIKEYCDGGC